MRLAAVGTACVLAVSMLTGAASAPDASAEPSPDPSASDTATPTPEPSSEPTEQPSPPAPTDPPSPAPTEPIEDTEPGAGDGDPPSEDGTDDGATRRSSAPAGSVPPAGRVIGADRFAVSVSASRAAFPNGADTVIVVSGSSAPDGVVAAAMSARLNAPVLFVQQGGVPGSVVAEIGRLAPASVVVVGGPGVVTDAVLTRLRTLAPDVRRISGSDRFDASRVALREMSSASTVYITEGVNLIDGPLGAAAAAANGHGLLLVRLGQTTLDAATRDALSAVGAQRVIVLGATGAIPASFEASLRSSGYTVERRVARDRFEASVLISRDRSTAPRRAIVANPQSVPDSIVAAGLAAASGQPMLYSSQRCMVDAVAAHVTSLRVDVAAVGGAMWLGPAVVANRSCSAEKQTSQNGLRSAIQSALSGYAGVYSVSVREWGGLDAAVEIGGGVRREPASMMKLFAAWAAMKRIEQGRASYATVLSSGVRLDECIHVIIHASDNYCHSDIVHWIGIPEINRMIQSAGFPNTFYGLVPNCTSVLYAWNRTTSNDIVGMLEKLTAGSILSRPYADHLLSLMGAQIWRSRIASGIPGGVRQVSKPGSLWVASGLMQGDTGIVYSPGGTYMISIIGDGNPPQAALRAVSRAVYQHFNGAFGAAAVYPVEQMVTVRDTALRTSPGGAMTVVVPARAPIQVLDAQRTWYQVQYGGRQLWTTFRDLSNR